MKTRSLTTLGISIHRSCNIEWNYALVKEFNSDDYIPGNSETTEKWHGPNEEIKTGNANMKLVGFGTDRQTDFIKRIQTEMCERLVAIRAYDHMTFAFNVWTRSKCNLEPWPMGPTKNETAAIDSASDVKSLPNQYELHSTLDNGRADEPLT